MIRQGDILITPLTEKIPVKGRKKVTRDEELDRIVVAEGEATGHHHAIHTPGVTAFTRNKKLYLRVPEGGAELVHEEHHTLKIPAGDHVVERQREYVAPKAPAAAPTTRRVWD